MSTDVDLVNLNSNFSISIGIDIVSVFTLNTSSPYITAIEDLL